MTIQITEMPRQDYSADTDYQPSRSVVDRLPFRAGMATLAATAIAGFAPEAGFSAEKYANTPVGVAREFATLFSKGKYIKACRLDHLNCVGLNKKDGRGWDGFFPLKEFVVPLPKVITDKVPGVKMVEVRTKAYNKNGPWCMAVQQFGGKWELVSNRWLFYPPGSSQAKAHKQPSCSEY